MELNDYHPFRSPEAKAEFLARYETRVKLWPIPSETTTIETSYGSTFVRMSGPVDGSPLVLLHGHSENGLNWFPNIEDLSQDFRTYAVDIISEPGRSVPTKVMQSSDDYTTWLDDLFEKLGLESGIALIGLSYGGWITGQYALRFPQRLNKIVLMAPAGFSAYSLKFLILAMLATLFQQKFLLKRLTRWIFDDFLNLSENSEQEFEEWFEFLYLGVQSRKPQPIVFGKVLTDAELKQLQQTPTLFLTGENEIVYSVKKSMERL